MMRRYMTAGTAIAALTLAAGSAVAQIDIVQPVLNDDEFAGLNTIVTFDVADGLDAGGVVLDGEALEVSFDLVDDMGNVVFGPFAVNTVGGAVNYNDGAGNADVQVDLGEVTFGTALANTSVTGIRLKVRTPGGTAMMFEQAPFDAADETADEVLTAVKANEAPVLQNAFISTDGMNAFFEFDRPLNTGDAANDDNQTVLADIDGTDFQIDTADSFDGSEGAPAGLSNDAFLGANNNILQFDRNSMTTDLDAGDWVRPAYNAMGNAVNDIFSIVGYQSTNDAVQVQTVSALTIESVKAFKSLGAGANDDEVILVTFNLPLDPADLGDDAFYSDALQLSAGGDSDLDIDNISAGPESNQVWLDITSGGTDSILVNALNEADGMALTLDTDVMAGDVPSSIFGTDDYETAQSLDVQDCISPSLEALAYQDVDGDGVQDAAVFVFGESLDSSLDGADADDLGITLTRRAGVTITPIGTVDPVTGEWTTYMTAASMMADDDEIEVTSIEIISFDEDGDGTISDLETDNAIRAKYDPAQDFGVAGGGWDLDDTTSSPEMDGPGTGDDNAVRGQIDADNSDIVDANDVSIDSDPDTADTDDIDQNTATDAATPVAVASTYKSGDNFSGGFFELFEETDGNVGDDADNNVWQGVFGETMTIAGADPSDVSWGSGSTERFQAGDTVRLLGANNNIVQIEDSGARGLEPGDTLTFASGNMIDDASGNELSGTFTAEQGTAPYVALQTDINNATTPSAFLFTTDGDDFANEVRLFTESPVAADSVQVDDFTFDGGMEFSSVDVSTSGTQITLVFPNDDIPLSNTVDVTYTAPADNDDPMSQIIEGTDGNAVFPGLTTTITAEQFPDPDVDADDLAIMDIRGTITSGGNPVGVGAKLYGMVAVPVPAMISGQISGIDFWLSEDEDLEAFFNFIYGFEDHLYLIDDEGVIEVTNDGQGHGGASYAIYDLTVNAANLNNVTFTGRGRSYTSGDSQPQTGLTLTGGQVTFKWDVLRSAGGTIESLKQSGYEVDGPAIASRAVVSGSEGAYAMHLSAPITQFYGSFGQTGWPVIMVLERATGSRTAVTSVLNAIDNEGPLLFNPLQRDTDPNDDDARNGGSNVVFDINLDNVGVEILYEGWQLLPFNRVSGFATTTGVLPTIPAIHEASTDDIVTQVTLPQVRAFNQFVYFEDNNDDDVWTAADDGDFLDSLIIDVDCIDHMRFTMTNRGVDIGSGISGFIGGYAAGFFNGDNDNYGVFQFGAAGDATEIFTGPFTSTPTLGWALVTAPADASGPNALNAFLSTNDADFVIEFNRTSNTEVDVNTFGNESDNINDVMEINAGQAYFVSFE